MRSEALIRFDWSTGSDPIRLVVRMPGAITSPEVDSVLAECFPPCTEAWPRPTATELAAD